jgi:membrane protease subunit (stomatin/prohibitin family)
MLENPKKDKLYFHFSTVPKPSMISLTTFKEGVNDLLAKEVIYKSTQDFTFFVNVNYLVH